VTSEYVSTGVAAKALGIDRGTLHRWWKDGLVEPAWVTPGGQARWVVDDLLQQLRDKRLRDE
jgi:DNA-binding transcriptional MerR regulator